MCSCFPQQQSMMMRRFRLLFYKKSPLNPSLYQVFCVCWCLFCPKCSSQYVLTSLPPLTKQTPTDTEGLVQATPPTHSPFAFQKANLLHPFFSSFPVWMCVTDYWQLDIIHHFLSQHSFSVWLYNSIVLTNKHIPTCSKHACSPCQVPGCLWPHDRMYQKSNALW